MLGISPTVWLCVGLAGQALFTARFVTQWLASEKRKESYVPVSFWWISLAGSVVLAFYAASKRDPVFVLSTFVNGFLYARNLLLIYFRREKPSSRRVLVPLTLAVGATVLFTSWRGLDPDSIAAPGKVVWLALGFLGAACWSGRFLIQWFASERAGKSVMPRAFWYVGLVGAVLLLAYSVARKDPVFVLGYLFPPFPYIRNLVLIYRKEGAPAFVLRGQRVWYRKRSRAVAISLFGVLLAGFLAAKVMTSDGPPGDFLRYHRAGRIVATGNADHLYDRDPLFDAYPDADLKEHQFRYLPAFAVLMAPAGLLPVRVADMLWAWLNAFGYLMLLAISWWMCRRYGTRAAWMWVPLLLSIRFGWDNVNLGQLNPTVMLCAVGGIHLAETGRPGRGGLLVGLGTVLKFMPGLVILVFALRRQWRALTFSIAGVILAGAVLPAVVLGPGRAIRLTRTVVEQQGAVLAAEQPEDVPGESLRAMSYRLLGPLPHLRRGEATDVSLKLLDAGQSRGVYLAAALALLAWLAVFALRCRDGLEMPLVFGATLAVGLMVSPESRQPHFLALTLAGTAIVTALVRVGAGTVRGKVVLGLYALAFALLTLPSRGILGPGGLWFGVYCAAGIATILMLVAIALLASAAPAGGPRPATDPGSGGAPSG